MLEYVVALLFSASLLHKEIHSTCSRLNHLQYKLCLLSMNICLSINVGTTSREFGVNQLNQIIFGWFGFLIVHEYMIHYNPIFWDAKSQICYKVPSRPH